MALEGKPVLDIPLADAAANALERDVIGNKTDAAQTVVAATRSLMAYIKGILGTQHATEQETEWAVGSVSQQIASAAAQNLTAVSVTPTFPAGSTRVRAILVAGIHVSNTTANAHNILLKVQGQKAAGGYTDLLDLTAQTTLGMVNLIGAADQWVGAIDVTAKVDASAVQYDFRFVVDSDNANAVNYTQNFTLVLVYTN